MDLFAGKVVLISGRARGMGAAHQGDQPVFFRSWDHQLMHRVLVPKVRSRITDPRDALEVVRSVPTDAAGLDQLYGTRAQTTCAMGEV